MQKGMLFFAIMFVFQVAGGADSNCWGGGIVNQIQARHRAEHRVDALNKRFGTSVFQTGHRGFRVMRFRGKMSAADEDANVDVVKVTAQ
ncbi:MAG: hypothetical protein JW913_04880 [Chitinispirillaceae bacterium]|nr:hypothetical protein [Chitinispirillaceae bacterium]